MNKILKITFVLFVSLTFFACNEDEASPISEVNQDEITVLYEKKGEYNVSNSIYDDHLIKIERIGKSTLDGQKINNYINELNTSDINLNDIKRFSFDNSDAKLISIPLENSNGKALILYQKKNNVKFAFASLTESKGFEQFELTDINGNLLYSVNIDKQQRLGNFNFGNGNINVNSINQETTPNFVLKGGCVSSTDNFGDCMKCGFNECADDWVCAAALALAPREVLAGFAIGCAFA